MSRKKVVDVYPHGGFMVVKEAKKGDYGKFKDKNGKERSAAPAGYQIRKPKNVVTDPRLLKIMSCMRAELTLPKEKRGTLKLGDVWDRFVKARQGPCKI